VQAVDIRHLPFYHGTSAPFVRGLLGLPDGIAFPRQECKEVCEALLHLLLERARDFGDIANVFWEAQSPWFASAPLALKNVAEQNDFSLVTYGKVYITLNRNIAIRYGCRSPYGSELLMFIEDTIRVLRYYGEHRVEDVLRRFPGISAVWTMPHTPVILELSGIKFQQLSTEMGETDEVKLLEELSLTLKYLDKPGMSVPGAFRAEGISPDQISAVYELSNTFRDQVRAADHDPFATWNISAFRSKRAEWQ
jgi:hypothetical protein